MPKENFKSLVFSVKKPHSCSVAQEFMSLQPDIALPPPLDGATLLGLTSQAPAPPGVSTESRSSDTVTVTSSSVKPRPAEPEQLAPAHSDKSTSEASQPKVDSVVFCVWFCSPLQKSSWVFG